ncbi:MAG: PQQ-binding-like beta-propeller repeat protein [Bacteroidia bacterium]|nr:PQQ-binding-like beta-propeller repeat protein [Bacteroidia bacterium]
MKNFKTLLILMMLSMGAFAQKECALVWKNEFPVEPKWKMINEDATLILGGNLNEIAMIDGVTGSVLWQLNFKKALGVKSAKDWNWNKEKGVVNVIIKGEKKEEDKTIFYDEKSGNMIADISTLKTKMVRTKTRFNSYIENKEKGVELILTYKKRTIGELFKNKPLEMTIECTGKINWSKTISAKVTTSMCRNRAEGGEPIIDFNVKGDKVYLIYDGISVIDLNTGNLLWQTTFDNSEYDFGLFKSSQTLGKAGAPLVENDGVYVVDLSKNQYCIKKFNLESGALIWKSEPLDKDAIVPELVLINNELIARFGGRVIVETYIPGQNGNADVYKTEPKMKGDFGLKGFDASTGKQLWDTKKMKDLNDKFSNALTNMINNDQTIYVTSDKNLYAFSSNGKTKFITPVNKTGLGTPVKMFTYENNLIVMFEEGIGSYEMSTGKQNYATSTKKALEDFKAGNAYFVWAGSDIFSLEDFVRFDLASGQILSKMKDTSYPYFSNDGEEFVKFKGDQYARYKTR